MGCYKIEIVKSAEREARKIQKQHLERIISAIRNLK